jgi:hypothetical protein
MRALRHLADPAQVFVPILNRFLKPAIGSAAAALTFLSSFETQNTTTFVIDRSGSLMNVAVSPAVSGVELATTRSSE